MLTGHNAYGRNCFMAKATGLGTTKKNLRVKLHFDCYNQSDCQKQANRNLMQEIFLMGSRLGQF